MTVRLYLFSGVRNSVWKLLTQFGSLRMGLQKQHGLLFARAMGCGRGIGFSMLPDFRRYAILVVGDEEVVDRFERATAITDLGAECRFLEVYDLLPLRGHGSWDGQQPFAKIEDPAPGAPVAVLTRADIPLRAIPEFIRHSRLVTERLEQAEGRIFSLGCGELPLIRQATFSIWSNTEAMERFAYGDRVHAKAMSETRRRALFGEQLFWRFAVRGYVKRPLN